jgi:arylsulfatase A-like enzyme
MNIIKHKHLVILISIILIIVIWSCVNNKNTQAEEKPNVLIIFTDDMGYADGTGNTEIPVPNLDRLADEGVSFTNAYVTAPICVASRMGLMSGCYQQRFGIYGNFHGENNNILAREHTLLPRIFQNAGYRTGLVGKWHLSGNSKENYMYAPPTERGFDEVTGISGGHSDFWKGVRIFRDTTPDTAPEYLTDLWGNEACQFIERNKEKPFFLYLAFNAVHSPMHALNEDVIDYTSDSLRNVYGGMMTAMDRNVGRVLDKLDDLGLTDNTIVVFLNDNGGGGHDERYADHSRNYADNSPFRGFKFDLYEGGIRTPFIISWPEHIKKRITYNKMVSSMDVYPTVVEAAGLTLPDQALDGVNLLPYLDGSTTNAPHQWLCWQNRSWITYGNNKDVRPLNRVHNCAIRQDNWKLVRYNDEIDSLEVSPPWKLYDLLKDVGETNDVSAQNPEIVNEMSAIFTDWRNSMHPSMEEKRYIPAKRSLKRSSEGYLIQTIN